MSKDVLAVWTIYKHPTDYPDKYIARRFEASEGEAVATEHIIVADTLEQVRKAMQSKGLVCLTRSVGDEPQIVETWL